MGVLKETHRFKGSQHLNVGERILNEEVGIKFVEKWDNIEQTRINSRGRAT